jgi:hypothetical protein
MDNMGLEDGDDALQYALMLSMEEQSLDAEEQMLGASGSGNGAANGEDADAELQEMLEMIRVAEERERAAL